MPDHNELVLRLLAPYVHSGLWLLVMALLVLLGARILVAAWRRRGESEGLAYVYAVYSLIPLQGAWLIYLRQNVDLRQGLVTLPIPLLYVFALHLSMRPSRRRSRRYGLGRS